LLQDALKEAPYSGTIFYPSLVEWDIPLFQRPHQVFRELAKRGYLVSLSDSEPGSRSGQAASPGRGENMASQRYRHDAGGPQLSVYSLDQLDPNIVCREMFPNCRVVYDFIDELEVFGYYCRSMEADHQRLLGKADVVITTADSLLAGIQEIRPMRSSSRTGSARRTSRLKATGSPETSNPSWREESRSSATMARWQNGSITISSTLPAMPAEILTSFLSAQKSTRVRRSFSGETTFSS